MCDLITFFKNEPFQYFYLYLAGHKQLYSNIIQYHIINHKYNSKS